MIVRLTGQLIHKEPTYVIVDVGGIGYEVRISLHTFLAIKTLEHCQLLTYQYIKGDLQVLYGFASLEEKHWFLRLISINSVGPRIAQTILSSLSPSALEQAIANGQLGVLKAIKGVGDKAAQRIVMELQGKLEQGPTVASGADTVGKAALAALIKLGLAQSVAEKALAKVRKANPGTLALESLIKQALQVA